MGCLASDDCLRSRQRGCRPAFVQLDRQVVTWLAAHHVLLLALFVRHCDAAIAVAQGIVHTMDVFLYVDYCVVGIGLLFFLARAVCVPAVRHLPTLGRSLVLSFATVVLWTAWMDERVYLLVGTHLYSGPLRTMLLDGDFKREISLDGKALAFLLGLLGIAAAVEIVLFYLAGRSVRFLSDTRWKAVRNPVLILAVTTVSLGGLVLVFERERALSVNSPLMKALPLRELLGRASRPALTKPVAYTPAPDSSLALSRRPDVLVILVESLRSDVATPRLMPNLDAFARDHRCLQATHHFSGGTQTERGLFSLLYGLQSDRYDGFRQSRTPALPLRVFKANGYELVGGSASTLVNWWGAELMTSQFDSFREFKHEPAYERDRALVSWFEDRRRVRSLSRSLEPRPQRLPSNPAFYLLFFDSTHAGYSYPPEFEESRPVADPNFFYSAELRTAVDRGPVENRYFNAVRWMDSLISSVMTPLARDLEEGNLVVLITGDHGEELWDHGMFGHTAARFFNEHIRVPLVLCLPGRPLGRVALSSHMDLMPTVLQALGLQSQLSPEVWSDGRSLLTQGDDSTRPAEPEDPWFAIRAAGLGKPARELVFIDRRKKVWLRDDHDLGGHFVFLRADDLEDQPRPSLATEELASIIERVLRRAERFSRQTTTGGR